MPKISVVLPVYNAESYLYSSIGSVLSQTYQDFEFLIINDGSTDRSAEIINSIIDKRIRFFDNSQNQGTATVSNIGFENANGEYIALMDADDISFPDRFEKQVKFLDSNDEVGVVGTGFIFSDTKQELLYPATDEKLRVKMFSYYPFRNSTLMLRNSTIKDHDLKFNPVFRHTLDYEFISRLIGHTKMANLEEPLLLYTVHDNQISTLKNEVFLKDAERVSFNMLKYLGIDPSEEEKKLHLRLIRGEYSDKIGPDVITWINKIAKKTITNPYFEDLDVQELVDKLHPSRRKFIFSNSYSLQEWVMEMARMNHKYYSFQEIIKNSFRPILKYVK